MMNSKPTPNSLGYRMPAEFEQQSAIWLSWPHNEETWPEHMLKEVEDSYVELIKALHTGQKVKILVNDEAAKTKAEIKLKKANVNISQTAFYQIKTVDAWIRDYGPAFVVNPNSRQKLAIVKWNFNAWGDKYEDLKQDNSVPYEINKEMNLTMFEPKIAFEGGSIDVNGSGTVLTTEQCLLSKNRNPKLSKTEIENYLKDYLNVSNILWLKNGIAGDDTDGHVDEIARFVNKNTVVCAFEEDKSDENYEILEENYELLKNMKDENGNKLNVVKLPMPGFVSDEKGRRLPASYANFYIGNYAVAVPVFGNENDKKALGILSRLFPSRKVVDIDCKAMVYGLGALHCISQQEPRV